MGSDAGIITKFSHSIRFYGESKLKKPKELKNIKQLFSVGYISKKCTCGVFVKDNDVWVKHRDYFSDTMKLPTGDMGQPLSYMANKYCNVVKSKKFVYSDAWGSIVLRNEAWICLKNLMVDINSGVFELDIISGICRQQEEICGFEEYELCCTPMERFWEKVVHQIKAGDA